MNQFEFDFSKVKTVKEFYQNVKVFEVELNDELIDSDAYDNAILKNCIFGNSKVVEIPISRIIGYSRLNMQQGKSILSNFGAFFDFNPRADGYHRRGIAMLGIPFDELIARLKPSFRTEPITTNEAGGKYFIDTNGLHRFTTIKLAYLIELYQGIPKELLDKKYTIQVKNKSIDEIKTFAKIILRVIDPSIYIYAQTTLDPIYRLSGNSIVSFDSKEYIMNDAKLLDFTIKKIKSLEPYEEFDAFTQRIVKYLGLPQESYSTAYRLIDKYCPSIIERINKKHNIEGEGQNEHKLN